MDKLESALSSAITIEIVTIIIVVIEAGIAIFAGIRAHSTALVVFGADSFIELVIAAFVLWRFIVQRRNRSLDTIKNAERVASWVAAFGLAALCIYIVAASLYNILNGGKTDESSLGIIVSVFAVFVMPYLAIRKRALAKILNSASLKADAACDITCAYMAGALLIGLLINALTGWVWIDSAVSLAFLIWLLPETKETFDGARRGELA